MNSHRYLYSSLYKDRTRQQNTQDTKIINTHH